MKSRKPILVAVMALTVFTLISEAFARGRGRPGLRIATARFGPALAPFRFYDPFYGFAYRTPNVPRERGNYGRVDFNVEPQNSQIWIDGTYIGIADDYNGTPGHAHLTPGVHHVRVVAPDGTVRERKIYVMPGKELNFNLKFIDHP